MLTFVAKHWMFWQSMLTERESATDALSTIYSKTQESNPKLIMEEWGACYFETENNHCSASSRFFWDS